MENAGTYYWIVLIISNALALILLYYAWKSARIAELGMFVLLGWAGIANWLVTTDALVDFPSTANITFSTIDAGAPHHWFINHSELGTRSIAVAQWIIAVCMLLTETVRRMASFIGIVLLLTVAPIGFGSPFPFTFIIILVLYALSRRTATNPEPNQQITNNYGQGSRSV